MRNTLIAFTAALLIASVPALAASPADGPIISSAVPDRDAGTIVLRGFYFPASPTVYMGTPSGRLAKLQVISSSDRAITARLRSNAPGTYLVAIPVAGEVSNLAAVSVAVGLEGAAGAEGRRGPQGLPGPAGAQGSAGAQGAQGPPGATGAAGLQGPDGPQGAQGPQGNPGLQGPKGTQGPVPDLSCPPGEVVAAFRGATLVCTPSPYPACENCHNAVVRRDPDGAGPMPPAPNIMGDGASGSGVGPIPRPYDDGTWGYNVNGHGQWGVTCADCHALELHHSDGTLNTLDWPGKPASTVTANTSHLVSGFFLTGTPAEQTLAFDNYCAYQCHTTAPDMRHARDGELEMTFGTHLTLADPKILRPGTLWGDDALTATDGSDPTIDDERYTPGDGPGGGDPLASYWFPWTMSDISSAAGSPTEYATCISCHDPHGTPTVEAARPTNRMLRYQWLSSPGFFCNGCHG